MTAAARRRLSAGFEDKLMGLISKALKGIQKILRCGFDVLDFFLGFSLPMDCRFATT